MSVWSAGAPKWRQESRLSEERNYRIWKIVEVHNTEHGNSTNCLLLAIAYSHSALSPSYRLKFVERWTKEHNIWLVYGKC